MVVVLLRSRLKKDGGHCCPPCFLLQGLYLLSGNLRACVGAHVAAQVFNSIDEDLDDVFRIVNERAGVLLDVLIVEGCLHQTRSPGGIPLAISAEEVRVDMAAVGHLATVGS